MNERQPPRDVDDPQNPLSFDDEMRESSWAYPPATEAGSVNSGSHTGLTRIERLQLALRIVTLNLPYLTRLAQEVRLLIDSRIDTACVTPSGRILFHPDFLDSLTLPETVFVMAHELYHLVLQTHARREGFHARLVNIAHDLIINDILETELRMVPPAGLLRCRGARHASLERILVQLVRRQQKNRLPECVWRKGTVGLEKHGALGQVLRDAMSESKRTARFRSGGLAGGLGAVEPKRTEAQEPQESGTFRSDVLTGREERELFPLDKPEEINRRVQWLLEVTVQSVALSSFQHDWDQDADQDRLSGRSKRATTQIEMLQQAYRPAWEGVVQNWIDARMPQPRSYARPSRRSGDRTDVVLPGRKRDSSIICMVLDTSGSMWPHLPAVLGILAGFCEAAGVEQVRILQCDCDITVDEVVLVEQLRHYAITGFSGWEGRSVRKQLDPPPKPAPRDRSKDKPQVPPQADPQADPTEDPPRRRRNKVVSRRKAQLSVSAGHQKHRRRKYRRGDVIRVRFRNRPDPAKPQELKLSLSDPSPRLAMRIEPDSNLAPALRRLGQEPEVESVLVVTDGEIEYPAEPMPYDILWALTPTDTNTWTVFEPQYGHVVRLEYTKA